MNGKLTLTIKASSLHFYEDMKHMIKSSAVDFLLTVVGNVYKLSYPVSTKKNKNGTHRQRVKTAYLGADIIQLISTKWGRQNIGEKCMLNIWLLCLDLLLMFITAGHNIFRDLVDPRSMVSCQKGPICHAYAWQIGPFWQDTLEVWAKEDRVLLLRQNGRGWCVM